MNINDIRKDFPQLSTMVHGKPLVYFDNAATTLKPSSVVEAINNHYRYKASNIHRGIHSLSEEGTFLFEQTRDGIKEFINAKNRHEIIFTKGTTDSINLVASSFCSLLKENDEIILSTLEHHSNIVPWQLIAEIKKLKIKVIKINQLGELDLEHFDSLLTNKTKIVSVNYISNALGTINPIEQIIQKSHNVGAKVLIDAAQAVLHTSIDVQKLNCDFLAFSMHKLLGPTGVGVLFGKEEILNQMPPYQGGGDMIDVVSFEKTTFNDLPHKFEAGTPHIAGVIASLEAINYVKKIGFDFIKNQEDELLFYGTNKLKEIKGLRIIGEAKNKASVISFVIDGLHPQDIATYIDRQGVAIRTGHHCTQPLMKFFNLTGTCRASFAFYNTKQEIDILYNSLIKCQELFL